MFDFSLICVLLTILLGSILSLQVKDEVIQIGGVFKESHVSIAGLLSLLDVSLVEIQELNNLNKFYYMGGPEPNERRLDISGGRNDGLIYIDCSLQNENSSVSLSLQKNKGNLTVQHVQNMDINTENEGEIYLMLISSQANGFFKNNNTVCILGTKFAVQDVGSGEGCFGIQTGILTINKQINSWICLYDSSILRVNTSLYKEQSIIKLAGFGAIWIEIFHSISSTDSEDSKLEPIGYRENRYYDVNVPGSKEPMVFDIGPGLVDFKYYRAEKDLFHYLQIDARGKGNKCPCLCTHAPVVKIPGAKPIVSSATITWFGDTKILYTTFIDTKPTTITNILDCPHTTDSCKTIISSESAFKNHTITIPTLATDLIDSDPTSETTETRTSNEGAARENMSFLTIVKVILSLLLHV